MKTNMNTNKKILIITFFLILLSSFVNSFDYIGHNMDYNNTNWYNISTGGVNVSGLLSSDNTWTLSAWIKYNSTNSGTPAFTDCQSGRTLIRWNDDSDDSLKYYEDTAWNDFNDGGILKNQWVFLTIVANETTAYQYWNGSLIGNSVGVAAQNLGGQCFIGANYVNTSDYLKGSVRYYKMFEDALNFSEIYELFLAEEAIFSSNVAPEFDVFEISNSLPIYNNDVVDLKFNVSDADTDNLSINVTWFTSSDNNTWTAHTSDDENFLDQTTTDYNQTLYHTNTAGDLEASDLDSWDYWKASAVLTDGTELVYINSSIFRISNMPINITSNSSGTTNENPVNKGEDITFTYIGLDNENNNVTLKVCKNSGDNWTSCTLLCQNAVNVLFDSVTPNNIACTYTTTETSRSNIGYAVLYDGGNYTFVNTSFFVNKYPTLTGFDMQDTSGDTTYYYGESIDYFNIDADDSDNDTFVLTTYITVSDEDGFVVIDNQTMNYTTDLLLNAIGTYNVSIYVIDYDGARTNYTTTFEVLTSTVSSGGRIYAYDYETLPSYSTINTSIDTYGFYVSEIRIDKNSNWTTTSTLIQTMKNASQLATITLETDLADVSGTLDFISTNYADLINADHLNGVRHLKLYIDDAVIENSSNSVLINSLTKRIFQNVSNKFPIYIRNYNHTDLNSNYANVDEHIYINATTKTEYLDKEIGYFRNNTDKSRIYHDLTTELKLETSYWQTKIINKMRANINSSGSYSDVNVGHLTNGDIIVVNNGSSEATYDITLVDVTEPDAYVLTSKYIADNNVSNINVTVPAYSSVMVYFTNLTKIVVDGDSEYLYGQQTQTFDLSYDLSSGNADAVLFVSSPSNVEDGRIMFIDPSFVHSDFYVWYGTNQYEAIANWSRYDKVIMGDSSNSTWVQQVANLSEFYGYTSVNDYGLENHPSGCTYGVDCVSWNRSLWITTKKSSIDTWTNMQSNVNIFIDGLDIGAVADVDGLFGAGLVTLTDYVKVSKQRKAILNTYTAYEDYANLGDYTMRESACGRWGGSVNSPTYTYESIILEIARANFHKRHGLTVLAQVFGNINDYEKSYYCYMQTKVFYGDLAEVSYNQPTFDYTGATDDYQWNYFKYPDLGSALEDDYATTGNDTFTRRFENGIISVNSTSHTVDFTSNDEIASMQMCGWFYDNDDGANDEGKLYFVINDIFPLNSTNSFNINDTDLTAFVKTYKCVDIPTDVYEESGFYEMEFYYIDDDANYVGNSGLYIYHGAVAGNDRLSFYETSDVGRVLDETDYTSYGIGDNWGFNFTINRVSSDVSLDDISSVITRTENEEYFKNITFTSTNAWVLPIYDKLLSVNSSYFNGIKVNGTSLNYTNSSDCVTSSPDYTINTVDGETWKACYYDSDVSTKGYNVKVVLPHLSDIDYYVDGNTPPNVTNQVFTLNSMFYGNQSWGLTFDASDENGDSIDSCGVFIDGIINYGTWGGSSCSVSLNTYMNGSDVSYTPAAYDSNNLGGNGTLQKGIKYEYSNLLENFDKESTNLTQYVYKVYNFTSYSSTDFDATLWSRNTTEANVSIDVTANSISQANREFTFDDLIRIGTYDYVKRADATYKVDNNEVVFVDFNVTYTNVTQLGILPKLNMVFTPSVMDGTDNQSVTLVGGSALNITGGSTISFNTTAQDDETKQYNITHGRKIVYSTNDTVGYVTNADSTRTYSWNNATGKRINFVFEHPKFQINSSTTIYDNILYSALSRWSAKTNYTEDVMDQGENDITTTFVDNTTETEVQQLFALVSGDTYYTYNLTWNATALYVDNSSISPTYPRFGDSVSLSAGVVDVTAGTVVTGYVNITQPNATVEKINLTCVGSLTFACNADNTFDIDEYGRWNYTIYIENDDSVTAESDGNFYVNNIENFNSSPLTKTFGENTTLYANITGDIDNATFLLYNTSNSSQIFINETLTTNTNNIWNTTNTSVLANGNYTATLSAISDNCNQTLTDSFTFTVTDEINVFPTNIQVAPDPRQELIQINMSMFTASYNDFNYTFTITMNSSQINYTIADANKVVDLDNYNSSNKYFNLIELQVNDPFIPDGEYAGNVTIVRTYDNKTKIIPILMGVNPPAGSIIVNATNTTTCSGDNCNLNRVIYDNAATTKSWILSNGGNYSLTECDASLLGSDFSGMSSYYSFDLNNFTINISGTDNLTLTIDSIPSLSYYGELEIVCKATSYGYLDSLSSRPDNVPKIRYLTVLPASVVVAPVVLGGGGGGDSDSDVTKVDCDITFNVDKIDFENINEFKQLIITNNEEQSYNPAFAFDTSLFTLIGSGSGILPAAKSEYTLKYLSNFDIVTNLTIIDSRCLDMVIPIEIKTGKIFEPLDINFDDIKEALKLDVFDTKLVLPDFIGGKEIPINVSLGYFAIGIALIFLLLAFMFDVLPMYLRVLLVPFGTFITTLIMWYIIK